MEARRRAAAAEVVVVNHHLFLADLRLKAKGHGEALPRYQAVIFDEAHLLPEAATQAFGVSVGQRRLATLLRDLLREVRGQKEVTAAAGQVHEAGEAFFAGLRGLAGPAGSRGLLAEELARLGEASAALEKALAERAVSLAADLLAVAGPVAGQTVAWVEAKNGQVALNLSPVEVGPHLRAALYEDLGRLVFTSATLAAGDDLGPMARRLGLPEETERLVVASPFDLARQAILYVPPRLPLPQSPEFPAAVAREVAGLLTLSGGRAFVLFTSHKNLLAVSRLLRERLPYPCLVQGEAPRMKLLARFKAESPSVLFATQSFWQGVDVPGPALSAVIVDKLPFAPPDDPLVAARAQLLEAAGQNGFAQLMVPEAIIALRQGLGRLLRGEGDRGLLAVLDVRLFGKGYGRRFLKALAPVPVTRELAAVARFFAAGEAGPG